MLSDLLLYVPRFVFCMNIAVLVKNKCLYNNSDPGQHKMVWDVPGRILGYTKTSINRSCGRCVIPVHPAPNNVHKYDSIVLQKGGGVMIASAVLALEPSAQGAEPNQIGTFAVETPAENAVRLAKQTAATARDRWVASSGSTSSHSEGACIAVPGVQMTEVYVC